MDPHIVLGAVDGRGAADSVHVPGNGAQLPRGPAHGGQVRTRGLPAVGLDRRLPLRRVMAAPAAAAHIGRGIVHWERGFLLPPGAWALWLCFVPDPAAHAVDLASDSPLEQRASEPASASAF